MMETSKRITLRLRGLDEDGGDVRLNDFVQQLDILKKALSETQDLLGGKIAYFKVVELQKNSPAQIVVEAVPADINSETKTIALVDKFFTSISEIEHGEYPTGFTYTTFEAYKDLTSLREKNRLTEISISRNGADKQTFLHDFSASIEKIVGSDEFETGTYTGELDAINIHRQNVFYVYPTSHLPKLRCTFPSELRKDVISAVGKYVTVIGTKKFKPTVNDAIPYEMHVYEIEVHPDEDQLPKLKELKGIAPNIGNGESSEDFIRGIRDEW